MALFIVTAVKTSNLTWYPKCRQFLETFAIDQIIKTHPSVKHEIHIRHLDIYFIYFILFHIVTCFGRMPEWSMAHARGNALRAGEGYPLGIAGARHVPSVAGTWFLMHVQVHHEAT
jgi:hypothetical protein